MSAVPCQRWTERRARYRPSGERIDPSRYTVAISEQAPARAFVERHHYSASWVAARLSVGLYQDRGCVAAEKDLVRRGAEPRAWGEEPAAWLARVLPTFPRLRHPGNHVYVWGLTGPGLPYPRKGP